MVSTTGSVIAHNLRRNPLMNQVIKGDALATPKEGGSHLSRLPGLQHDRLAQRVMAVHQPVIAPVELLDQPCRWHRVELAAFAAVTALAGQHKIPHAITIWHDAALLENPRKEVVDVNPGQRHPGAAIEATPPLITVERRPD